MLEEFQRYVPPPYRKAYVGMLEKIPVHVRNVCVVGDSGGVLGYLLKKRPGVTIYGVVHRAESLPVARKMFDGVVLSSGGMDSIPVEHLDGVLLCNLETTRKEALEVLGRLAEKLPPRCHVFSLFGDPNCEDDGSPSALNDLNGQLENELAGLGFGTLKSWPLDCASIDAPSSGIARLLMSVPSCYEPLEHVRTLVTGREFGLAYALLELIPRGTSESIEWRVAIYATRLDTIAAWLEQESGLERSYRLSVAVESFYFVTDVSPRDYNVYLAMARCWAAVGDDDMAARVLRSIASIDPNQTGDLQRAPAVDAGVKTAVVEGVPSWQRNTAPRVLFLMNPRPHYGIDILYDGLCTVLGADHVQEYPYKPSLHGCETDELKNYPCQFDWAGKNVSLDELFALLDQRVFDFILYADLEGDLPRDEMAAIVQRAGTCPVAIVDALDEMTDYRGRVAGHLGFDNFTAYFKREKHRAIDYGPNSFPLPFAYDRRRALDTMAGVRDQPLFWAGHRMFGTRRLALETLEARYGWDLNTMYAQDQYVDQIRRSAIGLNFFGMGFDTVRYWELPAQGCMLFSDRLPIEIPHNFVDGTHAVFFDDIPSMLEKLDHYMSHPEERVEIAAAGHGHYGQHHSNEARARQLLGWMSSLLPTHP
jgi:hypothetical protein